MEELEAIVLDVLTRLTRRDIIVKMAVTMFCFCVMIWITDNILYDLLMLKHSVISVLLFDCIFIAHTYFCSRTILFLWRSVAHLQFLNVSSEWLGIVILSTSLLNVLYLIHIIGVNFIRTYTNSNVDYAQYVSNVTNATFTKKYKIYVIT